MSVSTGASPLRREGNARCESRPGHHSFSYVAEQTIREASFESRIRWMVDGELADSSRAAIVLTR
jgi:hypothetical protein